MKCKSWLFLPLVALLAAGMPAVAVAGGGANAEAGGHHEAPPINWFELGYKDLDVHGHALEAGSGHHMAPPLGLALMNFAAFIFLLVWKAGPPMSSYLRGRHDSIKESLEEGKRLRDEAAQRLEEYATKIKGVESEVDALIADVRATAEDEKKRIIADAKAQAELMQRQAEAQIAAEVSRARAELEKEVMAAALAAAETILREKATAADQQKLIDSFLVELPAAQSATETPS